MIVKFLEQYSLIAGFLALIGVEISPININPLSWLGKLCGKLLGINELERQIKVIAKEVDDNELDRIRYEILQFSGSLRNGLKRTEVEYNHIEEIFQKYEKKGGNSYIHSEMNFIRGCRNNQKQY